MADISITLRTGNGDYNIELDTYESNYEAWQASKEHLDALVDEAVKRLKRAYTPASED